jgi:predicted aspartyl protease
LRVRAKYSEGATSPAPVLEVALQDPLMQGTLKLTARVDTGFSGSLLVTLGQYTKLGLQLYEEPEEAVSARLASGAAVPLRASKGVVVLGPARIGCRVYTTPMLLAPLLGRDLLNRWRAILDGPKKTFQIED